MAAKEFEALDKYLRDKKITRKVLSDRLGKSEQAISFKFNGKTEWSRSELQVLLAVSGMTDTEFVNIVMRNVQA